MQTKDLSLFIDRIVPAFILDEYAAGPGQPSFELFLSYFFEFLGKEDILPDGTVAWNPLNLIQNLLQYKDIDSTEKEFLNFFKNKYASQYPYIGKFDIRDQTTSMSIRTLIKKIREFYVSKGTMDSIRFFFRSVFNKEIEIYYPKQDILRLSDGKWFQPYYLGMEHLNGDPLTEVELQDMPDRYVHGQTSGARGYIESIPRESVPNAAQDLAPKIWISVVSREGEFIEGEPVNIVDGITNEVLYSFKLRTRGYELFDNTFPNGPYTYRGNWTNGKEFQIGDIVYNPTEDKFYLSITNHVSITYTPWNTNTAYRRASVVIFNDRVWRVKENRPDYQNNIPPNLDTDNWSFIDVVDGTHPAPIWAASTIYNNNDEVRIDNGTSWNRYRLNQFRTEFVSEYDPQADGTNWEEIVGAVHTDVEYVGMDWDEVRKYHQGSIVCNGDNVFVANYDRRNYSTIVPPPSDDAWEFIQLTDEADSVPNWVPLVAYEANDYVKNIVGVGPDYAIYRLKRLMPPTFISTTQPVIDPLHWTAIEGENNFRFEDEISFGTRWVEVPEGVNPENIGAGNEFVGRWIGTDGFLSSDKKIQDSFFYQDYSYQIKVDLDRSVFLRALIDNVHPSGFQFFNVVENVDTLIPFDLGVWQAPTPHFQIQWKGVSPPDMLAMGSAGFSVSLVPQVVFNDTFILDHSGFEKNADNYDMDQFEEKSMADFELNAGSNHAWVFSDGLKLPSIPEYLLQAVA